jgi:hypothetical protein
MKLPQGILFRIVLFGVLTVVLIRFIPLILRVAQAAIAQIGVFSWLILPILAIAVALLKIGRRKAKNKFENESLRDVTPPSDEQSKP